MTSAELKANELGLTIQEMQNYLLSNTDHKVVNELLESGMDWNEAIVLAYLSVIK